MVEDKNNHNAYFDQEFNQGLIKPTAQRFETTSLYESIEVNFSKLWYMIN